jgi:hypothetical protein
MHLRNAIDLALSSIRRPLAEPMAPFGLRATQWNADAEVVNAEAIVNPTTAATIRRFIDFLPALLAKFKPSSTLYQSEISL